MRHSPIVNSPTNVKRLTDNCSIPVIFDHAKKLGEGSFGSAYYIESPYHPESLVCKIISLKNRSLNFHFSSHHLLRLAYREVNYLQKCGLLIGYHHDQKNNKMLILMPYISGVTEWDLNQYYYPQARYLSFCALRALHRQGIVHMDPHESNFIYDPKKNKTVIIDFGMAQDHHFFRELRDIYIFAKRRHQGLMGLYKPWTLVCSEMVTFYWQELKLYLLAHKIKVAQHVILHAAVILLALAGVGCLTGISLIAKDLIQATLLQKLSEFLEMIQDHFELRAWNQHRSKSSRAYYYGCCLILSLMQGLILALQLSQIYTDLHSVSVLTLSLVNQTYLKGLHLWGALLQLPYLSLGQALIKLPFLRHPCTYWYNNIEKYIASEHGIIQTYQQQISQSRPSHYLPLFQNRLQKDLRYTGFLPPSKPKGSNKLEKSLDATQISKKTHRP